MPIRGDDTESLFHRLFLTYPTGQTVSTDASRESSPMVPCSVMVCRPSTAETRIGSTTESSRHSDGGVFVADGRRTALWGREFSERLSRSCGVRAYRRL
jgi:hypothetical protein